MLEIFYNGGNAVKITTSKGTMQIDPKRSMIGLNDVEIGTDIQLATEERFVADSPEALVVVDCPGEYEISDISVKGFAAKRMIDSDGEINSTFYRINCDGFTIGVVGNIAEDAFEDVMENLALVDVLIIPVGGGGYTLDDKQASKLIKQIEPKTVLPVHYDDSQLKYEVPQRPFADFVEEHGGEVVEANSIKLKKAADIPEQFTIFKLKLNK